MQHRPVVLLLLLLHITSTTAQVDWDKGTALVHLLKALHLDDPHDVLAIYIGDDRTDEDAFRELAALNIGFGILVSSKVWRGQVIEMMQSVDAAWKMYVVLGFLNSQHFCRVNNHRLHGAQIKPTVASYTLQDPAAVMCFLKQLVSWGQTTENRWHLDR